MVDDGRMVGSGARRASQLELSLRTGVSQRHRSCIETGRSCAGRETLIAPLDELRPTLAPWAAAGEPGNLPVLAFRLRAADGRVLSLFATITSFGTPLDITRAR